MPRRTEPDNVRGLLLRVSSAALYFKQRYLLLLFSMWLVLEVGP